MALTVKHPKNNNIASWTQAQLDAQIALGNFPPGTLLADIVLSQDWNTNHTVTGSILVDGTTITGDGVTTPLVASSGAPAFSAITSGTNTTATMVVGTGASLSTSGTGTITASSSAVLSTARLIGNVSFNGSADITPQQIQPSAENSDTTCFPAFFNSASGTAQQPKYNTALMYNASTGNLASTLLNGVSLTAAGSATSFLTGAGTYTAPFTLTTTGTSGAATFSAGTLNIPQYTGGGGSPGGSTTQVQYNNAGAFAGSANFTWNNATTTLTITNGVNSIISTGDSVMVTSNNAASLYVQNTTSFDTAFSVNTSAAGSANTGVSIVSQAAGSGANIQALSSGTNEDLKLTPKGTGTVTAPSLTLAQTASPTYARGRLVYNTVKECLTFFNNDSAVAMDIGQEVWIMVNNNSGSSIANGSSVYLSGATGGFPTIALAQGNAPTTVIGAGLATETIANGAVGYVCCLGLVSGIDTSAFTAGQTVYVSATTPGGLTATAPVSPNYRYRIGIVGVSSSTVGTIHVTPSTAALGNGTANQLAGINNAGTAQEYKSLTSTGGTVTITNSAGAINLEAAGSSPDSMWFGDGSDGNVTISSGTTTLLRDMYYNNLTISGTGSLNTNLFRIFVLGTLDLTNAPVNAITSASVTAGGAGSTAGVGGSAGTGTSSTGKTLLGGKTGPAGSSGATASSTAAVTPTGDASLGGPGGSGGNGEKGGNGSSGTGAAVATISAIPPGFDPRYPCNTALLGFPSTYFSAMGGCGGSGGGGDGTAGGGGGGGGAGGNAIAVFANTISRGASTAAGAITSKGADGGLGGSATAGNRGGGSGGHGGGGPYIHIVYKTLTGTAVAALINASSGAGGGGGNGFGTGTGGYGGAAGKAGVIAKIQIGGSISVSLGTRTAAPAGLAGGANTLLVGGSGHAAEILTVTL